MVPFYGQGMNAGFEDCTILSQMLDQHHNHFNLALKEFSDSRWQDAQAICDLAMYNYIEMRDLVRSKSYRLRKILDDFLYRNFPNYWIPLYNSVSFTHMPYKQCIENRKWQDKVIFVANTLNRENNLNFSLIIGQVLSRIIVFGFTILAVLLLFAMAFTYKIA